MAKYRGFELVVAPTDTEHRGYYEAAGRGELVVQKCDSCGKLRSAIGAACPFCTAREWTWHEVSGKGSIFSYIIVAHAVHPLFADWVPYPVILVELDEQRNVPWRGSVSGEAVSVRLRTNLVRRDDVDTPEEEDKVAIGARVEVCFVDIGDGLAVPQFRLAE